MLLYLLCIFLFGSGKIFFLVFSKIYERVHKVVLNKFIPWIGIKFDSVSPEVETSQNMSEGKMGLEYKCSGKGAVGGSRMLVTDYFLSSILMFSLL